MSSFSPARQSYARRHSLVIGRPISAQPLGDLLRLFGAERDGGAKVYIEEREPLGFRSVGALPSAEARRELWGVRLTGRREGKEGEEGKGKGGSAVQNACQ